MMLPLVLGAQSLSPTGPGSPSDFGGSSIGEGGSVKVNFPNTPVQAIIPFYTQLTGKKIILDSSLQGEPLRIIAPRPLTKEAAIQFIHATLLLNGYAMIPKDDDTMMLIHHSGGKDLAVEGLPVFNSIHDLPADEQVIHFVLPLQHISPEEAAKAFQEVLKLHAYGSITPVLNSSAVIITENSDTVRSLWNIAQIIDVPPAEIANEFIALERSDAERIAEIINEIYQESEKDSAAGAPATSNPAAQQPGAPGAAPNPAGVSNTAATNPTAAKVRVIPDRRTNSLLVIARPVDITYIKGLVEKLDQQSDGLTFMKRKLNFMNVTDFMPVAYDALSRDTDIQAEGGSGISGGSPRRTGGPSVSNNTPSTSAQRGDGGLAGSFGGGLGGGTGFGGNSNRSLLDDPEQYAAPQSVVVGRTLLIADAQSNSLIVSGSPEHLQIIDQLLEEIDVRPQQIYISTIIGQLTLGNEYKVGFDFLRLLDDFSVQQGSTSRSSSFTQTDTFGRDTNIDATGFATSTGTGSLSRTGTFNSETGLLEPGILQLIPGGGGASFNSLGLYGQVGALSRYLNLLDAQRNFKVLSRPSVYTTNNGKAVISSGQRIAVPTQILSNGAGVGGIASTSASIDYRDVVLKLEVVPLINSDDEVTLRIAQINDNVIGEQIISGNTIPTLSTQELVTTVTVKNGQTIVLGGLITEREQKTENGTFFLRRVPVIKHLFGTTAKTTSRDELLIFIQPNIISHTASLATPNQLEAHRSALMQPTLEFGGQTDLSAVPRALPYKEK
ncbi:MAG: hypothetical protein KDK99_16170 [Verrucomicrobiales bacterium]|nr:hypothetical protein [Verrucomicrobiales bacterium]